MATRDDPGGDVRVPPIVRSLGWVSFFTDMAADMVYPLLPALLLSLGGSAVWLGAMEGIAEGLSALVKWRTGPLVDRAARKKPIIFAGYALATLSRPVIAIATAGWHVVILRAIDRMGKGMRGVPRDALVAESVAKEHLATAFAFHRMMDNAGSVAGPIVAFAVMRGAGVSVRGAIAWAVVPGIISCAVLLFAVKERAGAGAEAGAEAGAGAGAGALPAGVKRYLVVVAIFTLGASADSFLLLRAVEIGMRAEWAPVLWLLLGAAKAVANMPGGWIADRVGRRKTLVAGWLLYAVFYAAAPFVVSPIAFGALVVAYGSYYGLAEGSERALLAELAPAPIRGRAFGAMHAVTGLAVLPANLIFGALYARHVTLAFGVSAACAAVAALLLLVLFPADSGTLSS